MKKVTLVCLMALFYLATWAANGTLVDGIYYNFSGDEATVTCSSSNTSNTNDYTGDIVIPEEVEYNGATYTVVAIGDYAFHGTSNSHSTITSVSIPTTVTSIGQYAFQYVTEMTAITIPNSVTSIGNYAFSYCTALQNVTIPNSVTSIGNYAFQYCEALQNVNIPESVTSIGTYVFRNCTSLEKLTLPTTLTTLPNYMFNGCTSLAKVAYSDSVENGEALQLDHCSSIGSHTFDNCSALVGHLTLPATLDEIDACAFQQSGFTSVTIEANDETPLLVKATSNYGPFYYCSALETAYLYRTCENSNASYGIFRGVYHSGQGGLKTAYIGGSATEVAPYSFYDCELLEQVIFEEDNKVTTIGDHTFQNCYVLESINLPTGLTTLGQYCFRDCKVLKELAIPDGLTEITQYLCYGCSALENVTFGENSALTTISQYAFQQCTSLTEFTIPHGVTSIGGYVWNGCTALRKIHLLNPEPVSIVPTDFTSDGDFDYPLVIYVPYGSEEAYEGSTWYSNVINTSANKGKIIFNSSVVTIDAPDASGTEDYASYYHPYALTIPDGVKAYAITSFDTTGTLTMTEVTDVIPEHSAVLLERDATSETSAYRIYIAEDDTHAAISGNLLYGSEEDTTTTVNGETEGYCFYGLTTKDGENLGFYWGADEGAAFAIPANKAWLALPSAEVANISYMKLKKDNDTTGIESIESIETAETIENGAIYTLQGVRVADMSQKGIYIVNGKKILVK